jgi:hypothetical protein
VRFAVKGENNTFFYAWTTTPGRCPPTWPFASGRTTDYAKFATTAKPPHGQRADPQVVGEDAEILEP